MIMYPPPLAIFNDTNIDLAASSSMMISFVIGITLTLVALLTALGNIIVLLAFYYDKNLRTNNGEIPPSIVFDPVIVFLSFRLLHFEHGHRRLSRRFLLHSLLHSLQVRSIPR